MNVSVNGTKLTFFLFQRRSENQVLKGAFSRDDIFIFFNEALYMFLRENAEKRFFDHFVIGL